MSAVKNLMYVIAKTHDIRSKIEDFVESAVEYDAFRSDLMKLELDGTINQKNLVDRAFITGAFTALKLCAIDRMQEDGYQDVDFIIEGDHTSALTIKENKNETESQNV